MKRCFTLLSVLVLAASASATAPQVSPAQQVQQLIGKSSGEKIGEALVVGTLLGCTQKQVGKEAFNAFYQEMNTTGKAISALCKQGQPGQARTLLLSTLDAKKNDPSAQAALGCYRMQAANIAGLGGQKMAETLAKYANWLADPALARRTMNESDVCKKQGQNHEGL